MNKNIFATMYMLRDILERNCLVFDTYRKHHEAKSPPDIPKAQANAEFLRLNTEGLDLISNLSHYNYAHVYMIGEDEAIKNVQQLLHDSECVPLLKARIVYAEEQMQKCRDELIKLRALKAVGIEL